MLRSEKYCIAPTAFARMVSDNMSEYDAKSQQDVHKTAFLLTAAYCETRKPAGCRANLCINIRFIRAKFNGYAGFIQAGRLFYRLVTGCAFIRNRSEACFRPVGSTDATDRKCGGVPQAAFPASQTARKAVFYSWKKCKVFARALGVREMTGSVFKKCRHPTRRTETSDSGAVGNAKCQNVIPLAPSDNSPDRVCPWRA